MAYDSKYSVNVKETCFGAIIDGEEDAIKSLVEEIRGLDPSGIFVKNRCFPPGDRRRCRGPASGSPNKIVSSALGRRGGGARTGYIMIEAESKMLPMISRALAATNDASIVPTKKKPLMPNRLEEIIKEGLI